MKIYHYTSIQTLALILHNKTIRFNRLDRVDDVEESIYGSGKENILLGKYNYVSCWTKSSEENIALWNMYNRYKGVRIGMDSMPFITYKKGNFESLLKSDILLGKDYIISAFSNPAKLFDIEYIDNPKTEIYKLVEDDGNYLKIDTQHIGIYKRKEWSFQQESRFKINLQPINVELADKYHKLYPEDRRLISIARTLTPSLVSNKSIHKEYIDLPLNIEKLAQIEVMLGPLTTEADQYIVEALLKSYPKASLSYSTFRGKLRNKD